MLRTEADKPFLLFLKDVIATDLSQINPPRISLTVAVSTLGLRHSAAGMLCTWVSRPRPDVFKEPRFSSLLMMSLHVFLYWCRSREYTKGSQAALLGNAAATAEQRHINYHKVRQSHLPTVTSVESKQRGGSEDDEEDVVVRNAGEHWKHNGNTTAIHLSMLSAAMLSIELVDRKVSRKPTIWQKPSPPG
ncbi:hypothetical protein EYF80_005912 [Liparis tanakae]|uniref:Uncharacterized protein n=1 Tax=Liparis tanakae TaxID=230148 RepID=A0A4Z2J0Q0_9TELE|nr:hypothetical protein EYF80_005912 [Liparis tanakae]